MKTFWKWFIGIVLGLLLLAVLVGIPLAMNFWRPAGLAVFQGEQEWGIRGPGMHGWRGMPMMHGYGGFGFMPFGGMLLGGLFQLGLLALVVVGIVWVVRSIRGSRVPARSCTKCGRAVQEDWKACPYCASKL
jgi:hypothetical protein